ncbi:MAG: bifunctional UDP-sugar hydrolase/5'-nucleotidase [Candidatus Solibacter sp.]
MRSRFPRYLGVAATLVAFSVCPAAAEIRTLTILHTNDLHARMMPLENKHGGFAYLATVIQRERANCKDCIFLNAGDVAQGTPVSTIFHGLPIFEVANLLGIDVATLGNHDFDYGWMQTRKFIATAKYPIVTSNVVSGSGANTKLFTAKPYIIVKVNGLRVAIIGAMTDILDTLTTPQVMQQWHTVPVVATARKYAAELKAQSDLIVLLAHITGDEEKAFLEQATEIPVMVTGHIHTGMQQPLTRDGRVLVRVRCYAEELGRLELKVDTEKKAPVSFNWKHITIDSTAVAPDPKVAALVKRWEDKVSARVDVPLAVSSRAFDKRGVRDLIEQAMRTQSGADFAFMNLGGVRDALPKGQLKVRNIWDIMPFDNRVVVGTFKGRDLPAVVLGDRKVEPDHDYTLAVSDFTATNQSSDENLRTTGLKFPNDIGLLRDVLVDWFRKKKTID